MAHVGRHCILEVYGCCAEMLNNEQTLLRYMRDSVEKAGATWLGQVSHSFEPQGVTALGLLSESHISIHTWPEIGYAAVDIFTCGDRADPQQACKLLLRELSPERHSLKTIQRAVDRPAPAHYRLPREDLREAMLPSLV